MAWSGLAWRGVEWSGGEWSGVESMGSGLVNGLALDPSHRTRVTAPEPATCATAPTVLREASATKSCRF